MKYTIKHTLTVLCLLLAAAVHAQTIERKVINTMGGTLAPSGGPQLTHNVGETFSTTLHAGGYSLTQGFLQQHLSPLPTTASCIPTTGLVAWYPFNGNANDESGNGNNGTNNGATLTTDRFGVSGKAYSFNGVSSFIEVNNDSSLCLPIYSISAWVKPNGYYLSGTDDANYILGKGNDFNDGHYSLHYKTISQKARASIGVGSSGLYVNSTSDILSSDWVHIASTWDGNNLKIYINGSLENLVSVASNVQGINSENLYFGTMAANTTWPYWLNGKLDDIAIYNRALTPSEITQLYNAGNVAGSITGATTVCTGATTTLSNTTVGGTWSSSNTSVATVGSTGVVTGVAGGTATISYSVTNACGSGVATKVITVNASPSAGTITGASAVCAGSTITLSNTTTGGTWSSSNTAIATVGSTGVVTGVAGGTVTISYTVTNSCGTATATKVITVNALSGGIPTSGLVAWYPFNGNANDESGNGNNGTITGSSVVADRNGVSSSAIQAVDTGSFIRTSSVLTGVVNSFSMSVWVNPQFPDSIRTQGVTGSEGSGVQTVIHATHGSNWGSASLHAGVGINVGTNQIQIIEHADLFVASPLVYSGTISGWHHITLVYESHMPKLYLDGALVSTGLVSSIPNIHPSNGRDNTTHANYSRSGFGAGFSPTVGVGWTASGLPTQFIGKFDDIAIYNRALTSTEILQLYNAGSPSAGTITGASTVNTGSTITLANSTTGGSWSSSNTSIATVGSTGVVTGVAPGTVTISYTVSNACGSASASKVVTVNAAIGDITGTLALCVGSTTSLSNSVSGGLWSSSDGTIATINAYTGLVSGISSGTATISYSVSGSLATTVVTVLPTPTSIAGSSSLCIAATTTLSSAIAGGSWSSSHPAIGSISSSGTLTGLSAGTTLISYTLASGCYATRTITVHPYPSAISGTLVVCQGGTTTLTSSPAGGTWSSSNTRATVSSSGVVTGVTAGTADITYTSPLGCMVKRQLTILATPAAISGHNTLCRYETTELTTESTGGSWSSSNTAVATIDEDGIVASLTTGTTLISYTLSGGCAATFGLTVNAAPAAITGSSTTCAGASVVLSTMTGGGTWSISDTAIATVGSSGIVTGISAGVATVSYTLSNGCYTTTLVTINTLPAAITGLDAVCVGTTTTYTSTTTGGSWSINMPTQATISSSGSLTALTAGNPVLTYTLSSGCRTTKSITINGLPSAITGTLTLCQSATTTLGCLPSGGSWVSGNTAIATIDTSGVLSAIATGTVSITYTTAAGCSRVAVATVTPAPTALSGSLSVCTGTTQLLSSSPSGGSWSTSNTSVATVSGGTVSGISAGTAHITYALSGGCRATATVTVSTSPAAISGTAALCQGSTTTLSNTTSGGSWSSSHTGIASIGSTGIVDGLAAGTATVSYTLSSGCARTVIVTIHALPSAFSGSLLLCGGSSSSLSSTPTGGSWSSSHTAIATVNMYGTVSAVAAGTSAISYTLATGCRRIGIVTVSVSPSAISGTASICVGQSTALTASPSGGSWSSANAAIVSIGSTGIATGIATGTAAISYTAASGCSSIRIVTVNNSPTAITGTGTVCVGATTALSSGPSGGTWRSSASARATVSSAGIVTGVAAGTATISYNMAGGCRATTIVTVLARPAAVSGAASLCAASVTTMSTTATGGTWSTSNTALATIGSTGILTGVSQGTVIVSYTFSTGCASTRSVVVNASPSAFSGSSSVCRGSSVSFTSSPGGGTWSSSSAATGTIGTTSGSFVGLSAGTTNITYRLSTGCSRVQTVTVNPSPDTLIGNRAICLGTTSTFTASPSGGSWSSSNTAVATISSSTGLANGLSAGTTVITYTASGGCYLTAIVTVNTSFASVIPTVNVCQGSTATLTPPVAGGVWSSTNTARATIDAGSGLVSGLSLGTVLISYTLGGGCAYTTIVNVSTTPATLYGATDVCTGRTATWVSTASGGSWSSSNPSIANINAASGLLTGVSVGTATISYTIVGCVRTRPVTVNASPAVITGPGTVVLGSSITLSNATVGGVWSSSNAARASVIPATGVVTGMSAGAATITYSDATNGCYQTKPVTVTVSRPGASTAEAVQAFRLHPNPTSGILYASASQSGILTLYTLEGKEIGSYPVGTAEVQIDLTKELSSGMYIGRFIGSNGYTETLRIIYTR